MEKHVTCVKNVQAQKQRGANGRAWGEGGLLDTPTEYIAKHLRQQLYFALELLLIRATSSSRVRRSRVFLIDGWIFSSLGKLRA